MDPSARSATALRRRVGKLMTQFITRWENMMAMVPMEETDLSTSMFNQYQMETETAWLIRNAEDTMRLIRHLQELWLFGTLDTVGKSDAEVKTEGEAKKVAELIEELLRKEMDGEREEKKGS